MLQDDDMRNVGTQLLFHCCFSRKEGEIHEPPPPTWVSESHRSPSRSSPVPPPSLFDLHSLTASDTLRVLIHPSPFQPSSGPSLCSSALVHCVRSRNTARARGLPGGFWTPVQSGSGWQMWAHGGAGLPGLAASCRHCNRSVFFFVSLAL